MIPNCTIWITKIQKSKLDNLKLYRDEPYYLVLDRLLDGTGGLLNGYFVGIEGKNNTGKK